MEYAPLETPFFKDPFGIKIWEKRHAKICKYLDSEEVKSVCDIGCCEGKLIQKLKRCRTIEYVAGLDIDENTLNSTTLLNCEMNMEDRIKAKERNAALTVELFCGDILKECQELKNRKFDALVLVELLEHIHLSDLPILEKNLFYELDAPLIIVTTPNYDFNIFFYPDCEQSPSPLMRHADHKFEMTRQEFADWTQRICETYGYDVTIDGVGTHKSNDQSRGFCSQIAVFKRNKADKLVERFAQVEIHQQSLIRVMHTIISCPSFEENLIETLRECYFQEHFQREKMLKLFMRGAVLLNLNLEIRERFNKGCYYEDDKKGEFIEVHSLTKNGKLSKLIGDIDLSATLLAISSKFPDLEVRLVPFCLRFILEDAS